MTRKLANDIAQQQFRAILEDKVNQLMETKLEGKFNAVVAPQGFHWGTSYGAMKYCNQKSLQDVDMMLTFDEDGMARFGDETFSGLYLKMIESASFKYSEKDQGELDQLKTQAMLTSQALTEAYRSEVGEIINEQNPLIEIVDFMNTNRGNADFVLKYPNLNGQYQTFQSRNKKYIEMTSRELEALNYLQQLQDNLKNPAKENEGMQVAAGKYAIGYNLPDVNQMYNYLTEEKNKMSISLEFFGFSQEESHLSIEHEASFVVPSLIFVFGRSNTKYTLNTLATDSSRVSVNIEFKGVTALDAAPVLASTDGTKGWYDGNLLAEIKKKTGKDETGYYLQNGEFDVDEVLGKGKRLNRMKEFVISQDPVITMTITNSNSEKVEECFKHNSKLDVSFLGFGISSSSHGYSVSDCEINEVSHTATITLCAPAPDMSTEIENKVGYVLGGFIVYPPESNSLEDSNYQVNSTPFTYTGTRDRMWDAIRSYLPGYVRLISLRATDYTGTHFVAEFTSTRAITQNDANRWVSSGLSGSGNFHFD